MNSALCSHIEVQTSFKIGGRRWLNVRVSMLAVVVLLLSGGACVADESKLDWISKEDVARRLEIAGYTKVTDLDAKDGEWVGKAVKDGKTYEIQMDPHDGRLLMAAPAH